MQTGRRLILVMMMGAVGVFPALVGAKTAHAAAGVTYYVAVGGTDASGDCSTNSASNAFPKIGQAITCANMDTATGTATASSPDTIQVAAGTYNESNLTSPLM